MCAPALPEQAGHLGEQVHQLAVAPERLCLRLPTTVRHVITPDSPLAPWRAGQAGVSADASSEIVVVVRPASVFAILVMEEVLQRSKMPWGVH